MEVSGHFKLDQVFMHNFSVKMSRYSHYIYFLQEKSTYFNRRVLTNFGSGVSGHFEPKESYKKNQQNLQEFVNHIKSSCMIFSANSDNSNIAYIKIQHGNHCIKNLEI